jgi:hypothetical protein
MGSSLVEFRGRGFWSWDGYLCDLLGVLATTSIKPDEPTWLTDARKEWLEQEGLKGSYGYVTVNFSKILSSEDRVHTFWQLIDAVQRRPDLTHELAETLTLLMALLKGELTTDVSSPLDYMVSGDFPYRGVRGNYP